MALPNHRVRVFASPLAMANFIKTDANITSVILTFQDNSGNYVLIYDIT